ncbi:hypothetical protein HN51_005017 [Arachis hypogaea]
MCELRSATGHHLSPTLVRPSLIRTLVTATQPQPTPPTSMPTSEQVSVRVQVVLRFIFIHTFLSMDADPNFLKEFVFFDGSAPHVVDGSVTY